MRAIRGMSGPKCRSAWTSRTRKAAPRWNCRTARLTAEQVMVRRERMLAIRSKVEALPEQQRLAVIMHKYQQMDYKQIADVLKKSESATKSLLFRAYETLREQLKEFV